MKPSLMSKIVITRLAWTCLKLTIETLKGVKYVPSLKKKHQNDVTDIVLMFLLTLNIFHTFF